MKIPSRHREHLTRNRWAQWWPIPLRLIVGYGFMEHGYAKLARGPESFANILHALGVPLPSFMAWATIAVELLGGLLILLGAWVTLAIRWPSCSWWPFSLFISRTDSVRSNYYRSMEPALTSGSRDTRPTFSILLA